MKCWIALLALLSSGAVAAEEALPLRMQAAMDVRQLPHDSLSVYVRDLDSGELLLDWNADEPRNPGSVIKMLTTLVALDVLGPTYTWRTELHALGEVSDGRLDGDLLIRGHGDPFLVTERVWQMLRRLRQLGVREISGDLLIDDSYFRPGAHDPGAFDNQPLRAYNVAPNALLMNFKTVRFWFEPEPDGNRVRIWLDPALSNIEIDNRLRLVPGACRGYQRGIAISVNEAVDRVTFSGSFPRACRRYAMDRAVLDHDAFVYGLFQSLWRESGGVFDGGFRRVLRLERNEPLLEFDSLPLADIIARVNKHSNNVMARQLVYTLAAEVLGAPGTEAGGRRVIERWLADAGLDFATLKLDNGAGLSRDARISAAELGAMLQFAWRQPYMPEYLSSLSLAGLDGTLSRRFEGPELEGFAHLKTGSLDHVAAIAGFLQARSGRRFAVVSLHNQRDVHRGPGEEVQEALLRWLMEQ